MEDNVQKSMKFSNTLIDKMNYRINVSDKYMQERIIDLLDPMYLVSKVDTLNREIPVAKRNTEDIMKYIKSEQGIATVKSNKRIAEWAGAIYSQEKECKYYLDNIKKLAIKYKDDNSESFLKAVKEIEPKDKYLSHCDLTWGIWGFLNYYLPLKWNMSKRIYSVDIDWLDYLKGSIPNDFSLFCLHNLPYDTFSVVVNIDIYDFNCIFDYDREKEKIYMGLFYKKKQFNKDDEFEICSYSVLDVSSNVKDALDSFESISVDDLPSITIMSGMHLSFWRHMYYKDLKMYTPYPRFTNSLITDLVYNEPNSGMYMGVNKPPKAEMYDISLVEKETSPSYVFVNYILGLLIFLSSENSAKFIDTSNMMLKNRNQKKSNKNRSNINRKQKEENSIVVSAVGVKETNLLKEISKRNGHSVSYRSNANSDISIRTVSPHIRKAHWHHYWVGKKGTKDRKLILKFLMPTMVGSGDSTVVHKDVIKK